MTKRNWLCVKPNKNLAKPKAQDAMGGVCSHNEEMLSLWEGHMCCSSMCYLCCGPRVMDSAMVALAPPLMVQ